MNENFYQYFAIDRRTFRAGIAFLLMITLPACVNDEDTKTKYLERGKTLLQTGNYEKARLEFKNVLQVDPRTAEPWFYLGQIAEQEQIWSQAFGSYKKAVELDKNQIRARARLAQFYLLQANAEQENGNTEGEQEALLKASDELEKVLTLVANDPEALSIQASMMARNGDTESAVKQLKAVIKNSPGHTPAIIILAKIIETSGDPEEARSILERGARKSPDDEKILFALVQFYSSQKLHARTVDTMRNLISIRPDDYGYRTALAAIFQQKGQLDRAEQVLRNAILVAPEDQKRYLQLIKFLLENRSQQQALVELQQFAKDNPELDELQLATSRYYIMTGDTDNAISHLLDVIKKHRTAPIALRARNQLAQLYASLSRFEQAEAQANIVLEENPHDYDAQLLAGRLAFRTGNYSKAITTFRSLLKEQPDAVNILNYLAETHLQLGETELAGEALLHAAKTNPFNVDSLLRLARYYQQRGETGLALKQVEKALDIKPKDTALLTLKADLLETQGDREGARKTVDSLKATNNGRITGYLRSAKLYLADGQFEHALADTDSVLEKHPDNLEALVIKADILTELHSMDKLKIVLRKLKQLAPEQLGSHYRMGRYYLETRQPSRAIHEYEIALTKARTPQASMQLLAEIVNTEINNGEIESAKRRLKTALKDDPRHPVAHDLLGAIYLREKKYPEAEEEFEKQLAINAKSAVVYIQLASTHLARQNTDGAIQVIERGLKVLPDNPLLARSLSRIRGEASAESSADTAASTSDQ